VRLIFWDNATKAGSVTKAATIVGLGLVAALLPALAGCASAQPSDPSPTVKITSVPAATARAHAVGGAHVQIGAALTRIEAWDICYAHTSTEVDSDASDWGRYTPSAVDQQGPGRFVVTITNVTDNSDQVGTVTCTVNGRIGEATITSFSITPD
jgi:hypothetical protein